MARNRVTGGQALRANLQRAGASAAVELNAAMYQEAEAIMAVSKRIVPVKFGTLRGSGRVVPMNKGRGKLGYALGGWALVYGDAAEDYAIVQHERLDYRHTPPGQAKYLEQPFREAQTGMEGRLARRIGKRLESRVATGHRPGAIPVGPRPGAL